MTAGKHPSGSYLAIVLAAAIYLPIREARIAPVAAPA